MFKHSEMVNRIQTYLSVLQVKICFANNVGKTDINKDSEMFFCKLLNLVYKLNLTDLNKLNVNFPAIDLGDADARICYQVTSMPNISKVEQTLEKFKEKELYKEYDSINILILGNKHKYTKKLTYKEFTFNAEKNILDIRDLSNEIAKKDISELNLILGFFEKEYKDEIIEIINQKENKELCVPRQISEYKNICYYTYGLGQVRIDAYLPTNLEQELSCCILFQQIGLSDCMISFNEESIKEKLFKDCEKGLTDERSFIWYIDANNDKAGITFPNNTFVINIKTAQQLCEILKDLYESYLNSKQEIYNIVGANRFLEISIGEFLILRMPKQVWVTMVDFAQEHDYLNGDTEWDIFNPLSLVEKNHIMIYKNHLDNIKADVLAELHVRDMSKSYVDIIWKPGYTPSVNKMEGFDNKVKWKVDFTHDWVLEEFIPYIFYLDTTKDNRTIVNKLLKKGFSFERFKKTFNYKELGIESLYLK